MALTTSLAFMKERQSQVTQIESGIQDKLPIVSLRNHEPTSRIGRAKIELLSIARSRKRVVRNLIGQLEQKLIDQQSDVNNKVRRRNINQKQFSFSELADLE